MKSDECLNSKMSDAKLTIFYFKRNKSIRMSNDQNQCHKMLPME